MKYGMRADDNHPASDHSLLADRGDHHRGEIMGWLIAGLLIGAIIAVMWVEIGWNMMAAAA